MKNETERKCIRLSTVAQTTGESVVRIGGSTAGGAVVGGALGSLVGPIGTGIGAVLGGASGLYISVSGLLPRKSSDAEK
jgi:phage tail tape-measure protein